MYLVTNRITGGSFVLGDHEKQRLRELIEDSQDRFAHKVWDLCLMDNHYHLLIEIPPNSEMSREEVLRCWLQIQSGRNPGDPGDAVLDAYRAKIHDLSGIVGNFQQRFSQWFNRQKGRWGKLFGAPFDSVLLDTYGSVGKAMAYITLNPVRAGMVSDPAEYHWCGYAERMAKGRLRDDDHLLAPYLIGELGLPQDLLDEPPDALLERLWKRFRESLLGHSLRFESSELRTLADLLNAEDKPAEVDWPKLLQLQSRFVTKGLALGSQEFIEEVLQEHRVTLGYSNRRQPLQTRAWDGIYSLKNHRKWIS